MVSRGDDRARIRHALIALCWERGLASITEADVAARAGVDAAAFHRHYRDLEDCFFHVYRDELERFRRAAAATRAGFLAWSDRIRATAYALYRTVAGDEKLRWFTTVQVRAASERTQRLFGEEVEALFELIDEGRREATVPTEKLSRATAETIGGGIFNQVYVVASQRGPMPSEAKIVPELMYGVVLPYRGEEAARQELTMPVSDHRRSPVFAALIDLCWERDVSAVGAAEIVARSGIDATEFERRFGDVAGCLDTFFEAEMAVMLSRLEAVRVGQPDWASRLRATAYELLELGREDRRAAKLTSAAVRTASERVRTSWADAFTQLVEYIDEARDELPAGTEVTFETAEAVAGDVVRQLWERTGAGGELPDSRAVVPELMYKAVLPYRGEEAAREELTLPPPPTFSDPPGAG